MDKIFKGFGDKFSVNHVIKSLVFLMVILAIIGLSGAVSGTVIIERECDDGIDNDGDGQIDWNDAGCQCTEGMSESEECCDNIDNDGDGPIDWNDAGCECTNGMSESEECCDNIDNDNDGNTDWEDPGCYITDRRNETGETECDDGIDNDNDALIDVADPGCMVTNYQNETGNTQCDDGIDNDNDALIDVADPGCMVTNYQNETGNTQCSDGIDNDGDGAVDMLDQGCESPWDNNETNVLCNDGLDNDGDGLIDMNDFGCMGLWDNDETNPKCSDGVDNDGDGLTDFPEDPGCMHAGDDDEFNPAPPPDNVDIGSSGSVREYDGIPSVNWHDQITIKKSLNSSDITWVEIIITPDSGGITTGVMSDIGPDPSNSSNHIYSFTFTPYPAHGATHIQIIEHRTTGDTVEDFSIYIDPSGWIYDSVTGDIIVGANVTLYYENPPGSGSFMPVPEQSPAIMLPNVTSMLSDATGHYGWDVIPGNYTVKVSAPGYYPNNSVRIVTIPPAVFDLNVYLTPIITGELKTALTFVDNAPPYIEWLDVNLTGKLVTKCAVACDNNSVADIADVEAYIYDPSGMLIDHEYLMLANIDSVCQQMVNEQDQDFYYKYDMGICDLYEGNYTLPNNAPNGTYKVIIEVNDSVGEYGNGTDYFNYSVINPPFIEWMWELPDEDNFTNGTQVYPVPGGNKTVTKCVIACDYDGVGDIADVEAEVYYPNGHHHNYANEKEHEYLQLASNSSICRQTIPPEDIEFQHKYEQGICEVYEGNITMEFWEPPGDYLIKVEVNDTSGTYGHKDDTFEYMTCVAIDNDANLINFSSVVPGSSSQITGDNDMTTLNAPTVRNLCNVPVDVIITGMPLSCTMPATCNAATIPMPTYELPVQPIEPGQMSTSPENFQLNIPLGTLRGSYQGSITVAGVEKKQESIGLELVAEGFVSPVSLVYPNDGTKRSFIVDQIGEVKILTPLGQLLEEPFLNISDRMVNLSESYDERGLLGLAFHPDFSENGRFFVYYSAPLRNDSPHQDWDHTSHISEFMISNDSNKADLGSEKILLQIDEPQRNHNAGQIAFGPDGFLYIALGDGGGANDVALGHPPDGNGQNTSTPLGSILRIDVDSGNPYSIPSDNPFVGVSGVDEIFAYGFRNPYRMSFDAGGDHSLFVGDVGQKLWEEVDIVTKGNNYGWHIKEGNHCFDPTNPEHPPHNLTCPDVGANGEPLIGPIIEYNNAHYEGGGIGHAIVGGYVYRGSALPKHYGHYFFGDWSKHHEAGETGDGVLLMSNPSGGMWSIEELMIENSVNGRLNAFLRGFGQDADLELYVLTSNAIGPSGRTGKVYKIVPEAIQKPSIELELVAEGLVAPVSLVSPNDGTGRSFIVDQIGEVKILAPTGQLLDEPFLNISDRMVKLRESFDERGLLGLAFHPDFSENGRFFVYYSAPLRNDSPHQDWNHTSHISEFNISNDPDKADLGSEKILLQIDQPQFNHNAGQIAFGPDGFLYIALGDGGGANDVALGHPPNGNGQNISTPLGSILRIDVDSQNPYAVPPDNPFVGEEGVDEIFAYGFRNPYRMSFDAGGNHSLFVGDVGQNLWEEVDIVTKGNNYGWNIKEGAHCFDPNNPGNPPPNLTCPDVGANGEPLIGPIVEYKNAHHEGGGIGYSVIGGFVYRGNSIPKFYGSYIFGDWSNSFSTGNGTILAAENPYEGHGMQPVEEIRIANIENGSLNAFLRGFGQDDELELYVLTSNAVGPSGRTGKVYKIVPHFQDYEYIHGIAIDIDGEDYYFAGPPDGPGGSMDIPGHYWVQASSKKVYGLHYNTGPFNSSKGWSSDADNGALLYSVDGIIDTWTPDKSADYAAKGYVHYHEMVKVSDGSLHPTKVVWFKHFAEMNFTLSGGPHPELGHNVTAGLVDMEFINNYMMPYVAGKKYVHGIVIDVDGTDYYLKGPADGPGGAQDVPGHTWVIENPAVIYGKHYNTGPFNATQWWSSDAGNGTLLYWVYSIIDTWDPVKAEEYASNGYVHYHELVKVSDGSLHPTKVVWLKHFAVAEFTLDGGPHPELNHSVSIGVDFEFINNYNQSYSPGQGGTVNVTIKNFAFIPQNINITKGTTVIWTNEDVSKHTATDTVTGNIFDSGDLYQWDTFSYTFNGNGTFSYYCVYHPFMTGSVIVE